MENKIIKQESNCIKMLEYTVHIVSSYLTNNKASVSEVIELIDSIYKTLELKTPLGTEKKVISSVEDNNDMIGLTIKPEYIICLEDGKRLKMLKRYLKTKY